MKKTQNIEFYFICNATTNTDLIEKEYIKRKNTTKLYINAYLAYKAWQNNFKDIDGELSKGFLTLAATKYLIHRLEIQDYRTPQELQELTKELEQINKNLAHIEKANELLEL